MGALSSAQQVKFGAGLRHELGAEVKALNCSRALLLSTPNQQGIVAEIANQVRPVLVGHYAKAAMHTPVDITDDALALLRQLDADCLIAVGGGSTTGLGKALSLRTGLPQIVLPTTYAGSEATPILGQTENGIKKTLTDAAVLPDVVLYDPELAVTLPQGLSMTSGLNAMAHAVEALYARDRTDETTALATDGLRAFSTALPLIRQSPDDIAAREQTLRGAWACGAVLGQLGMALHHKLCHTLGGSFNLPHAETHAIILPHATAFNAQGVPDLLAPVTEILGGSNPGSALWHFAKSLNSPLSLRDFGLQSTDLDRAAELATTNPYWNPVDITYDAIRALLQNAYDGVTPDDM